MKTEFFNMNFSLVSLLATVNVPPCVSGWRSVERK